MDISKFEVSKFYVKDLTVLTRQALYILCLFYQSKLNANKNSYKKYYRLMSSKLPTTMYLVQKNPANIFLKRVYLSTFLEELCNWSPSFSFLLHENISIGFRTAMHTDWRKDLKFLVNENASANNFQKESNIHTTSSEWWKLWMQIFGGTFRIKFCNWDYLVLDFEL